MKITLPIFAFDILHLFQIINGLTIYSNFRLHPLMEKQQLLKVTITAYYLVMYTCVICQVIVLCVSITPYVQRHTIWLLTPWCIFFLCDHHIPDHNHLSCPGDVVWLSILWPQLCHKDEAALGRHCWVWKKRNALSDPTWESFSRNSLLKYWEEDNEWTLLWFHCTEM